MVMWRLADFTYMEKLEISQAIWKFCNQLQNKQFLNFIEL